MSFTVLEDVSGIFNKEGGEWGEEENQLSSLFF